MKTPPAGSDRLVVKPAPGRGTILHPRTFRPIREDGQDVTAERFYFHRMLRTGDVVLVEPAPGPVVTRTAPKKEE
jgi:hypothetical protein